jgi:Ser/Thr protein kinase RdoA (MazF antagonist)
MFEAFYKGYRKEKTLAADEIRAIYDCIAIVHYDLIATIVITDNDTIMHDFIDEQYDWLMRWKELCKRKKGVVLS